MNTKIKKSHPSEAKSFTKNGVNVTVMPMNYKAYSFIFEGKRWVFVNAKLERDAQKECIKWGVSLTSEMEMQK